MKQIIRLIIIFLAWGAKLSSEPSWLELKAEYFLKCPSKCQHLGSFKYGLEFDHKFKPNWGIWLEIDDYKRCTCSKDCVKILQERNGMGNCEHGFSEQIACSGETKRRMQVLPLMIGVKHFHQLADRVEIYEGVSLAYYLLRIRTLDTWKTTRGRKWGINLRLGMLFRSSEHILFDLYGNYAPLSYQIQAKRVNLGGFSIGLGLGYIF